MSEGQAGVPPRLAVYRDTIDNLDAALVHLLAERFRCTQQVGLLKARLDLPPADPGRERQQVARLRALAEESGLDPIFAELWREADDDAGRTRAVVDQIASLTDTSARAWHARICGMLSEIPDGL